MTVQGESSFPNADIKGNCIVRGILRLLGTKLNATDHFSTTCDIQKSMLKAETLREFAIPFLDARVHDSIETLIGDTPADDDLGIDTGTWSTTAPSIIAGDLKNAGATTRYALLELTVPQWYDATETLQIRFNAGMLTTVASVSATLDIEVYQVATDGTLSADLCDTAAQSINSTTFANKDFDILSATPGDRLLVRIAIAVNDSATGTAVDAAIKGLGWLADTRGTTD